jgi:hypothetical protein
MNKSSAFFSFRRLVVVFLTVFYGLGCGAFASPSPECNLWSNAWCIDAQGQDIEILSERSKYKNSTYYREWIIVANPLTVYDNSPLIIREPDSCYLDKADEIRVLSMEKISEGGSDVRRIVLSLRRDGECNFLLFLPDVDRSAAKISLKQILVRTETDATFNVFIYNEIFDKWDEMDRAEKRR